MDNTLLSLRNMIFHIITIFPRFFDSFLEESLIERARKENLIEIKIHNLREFTDDPHRTVDDRPFGGGIGMVYKVGPVYRAVKEIKQNSKAEARKSRTILFTPRGEKLTQGEVTEFSRLDQIIMICGRYEGVDERVGKHIADHEISIGDYVLLGGEVPAMALTEAVSRLLPGVIGEPEILEKRVTEEGKFKEYEQYTRPRVFEGEEGERWEVPEVLLSGHHEKIRKWRRDHGEEIGES